MELELNEPQFPGFTAEAALGKSGEHYGCAATSADSPHGVSMAAFCWDPYRFKWVLC
jgi:hypothetical protein